MIPWMFTNTPNLADSNESIIECLNAWGLTGEHPKELRYCLREIKTGKRVTEPIYSYIQHALTNNQFLVNIGGKFEILEHNRIMGPIIGGKCGIIDSNGNEIIPIKYDSIFFHDSSKLFICNLNTSGYSKAELYNIEGENITPYECVKIEEFGKDSVIVHRFVYENGINKMRVGIIKVNGEVIIPFIFDYISKYNSGSEIVKIGEKLEYEDKIRWGLYFLNEKSSKNFQMKYHHIIRLDNCYQCNIGGIAEGRFNDVIRGGKYGLVDFEGNEVIPVIYDSRFAGLGKYMIVNKGGFPNGSITVGGKWGLINAKNEVIIDFKYVDIESIYSAGSKKDPFLEGIQMFKVATEGEHVYYKEENYFFIRNGRYGIITIQDQIIIPPIYSSIKYLGYGFFKAMSPSYEYYIYNTLGSKVFSRKLHEVGEFVNGKLDGKEGVFLPINFTKDSEVLYMDISKNCNSGKFISNHDEQENLGNTLRMLESYSHDD